MIEFEEIKKYLPQYLSSESQDILFEDLKKFPSIINDRFYSRSLFRSKSFFQGDGVKQLLVINFPDPQARELPSMIFSNSCDIDPDNKRLFPSRFVYAPIFQLEKYKNALIEDHVDNGTYKKSDIENHIQSVKKQFITQILFLPKGCDLLNESLVFLDRLNNCPVELLNQKNNDSLKLFTLSNYGFYLFLIKISIHFTRVQEGIDRSEIIST
jgi:hypothetical protein